MRAYADTSFLVKLISDEPGSEPAIAQFRRLDFPTLFFLPLHGLEVTNAIRHRAFHLRHSAESSQRDAALARVERWLKRGWLIEVTTDTTDCDAALLFAKTLSTRHTERLGCRGFDLLHVALALELESRILSHLRSRPRRSGARGRSERHRHC